MRKFSLDYINFNNIQFLPKSERYDVTKRCIIEKRTDILKQIFDINYYLINDELIDLMIRNIPNDMHLFFEYSKILRAFTLSVNKDLLINNIKEIIRIDYGGNLFKYLKSRNDLDENLIIEILKHCGYYEKHYLIIILPEYAYLLLKDDDIDVVEMVLNKVDINYLL